jgi:putative membrane protein insertion efficiency factor
MPPREPSVAPTGRAATVSQHVLVAIVRGYRLFFKAWVGNVCRYEPSCSSYMLQAVQRHGAARGAALGSWRILRCNPWCQGGCDPVPEHPMKPGGGLFTRLVTDPQGQATRGTDPTKECP